MNYANDAISKKNEDYRSILATANKLEILQGALDLVVNDYNSLTNEELIELVKSQRVPIYKLESLLGKSNASRCVEVRREFYKKESAKLDETDPLDIKNRAQAFDVISGNYGLEYEKVIGACCENVIGHVKVPVGLAGPLILDGEEIFVPLATTEGCLVASINRGMSALRKSGGVSSVVRQDFMTRAPLVRFQSPKFANVAATWLKDKNNENRMRKAFNLNSRHCRLLNYTVHPIGREIHIRFHARTGDAMGMNMCSKGAESALKEMQQALLSAIPPVSMDVVAVSGNMCTDKKAAAINWINGRGKSVECNAELPAHVVKQVFKVTVDQMIDRWLKKVMIGSALAGTMGGFNCQAANIVTAIFIATGQDPAQNITSSNCILTMEKGPEGSLVVCCSMPSIECGTVGGGTILRDQSTYLQIMGIRGPTPKHHLHTQLQAVQKQSDSDSGNTSLNSAGASKSSPSAQADTPVDDTNGYTNARKLARIICASVMAGELSLLGALSNNTLVKSHEEHNRSSKFTTCNYL